MNPRHQLRERIKIAATTRSPDAAAVSVSLCTAAPWGVELFSYASGWVTPFGMI